VSYLRWFFLVIAVFTLPQLAYGQETFPQVYKPNFDVPSGIQVYPVRRYAFVFTGTHPKHPPLIEGGEYVDKVYWYVLTNLSDANGNIIPEPWDRVSNASALLRIRFTNGDTSIFGAHEPHLLSLTVRYLDKEKKFLEDHNFYHPSAETTHEMRKLVSHDAGWWNNVGYIEILTSRVIPGSSAQTGGGFVWPVFNF
jgi:hypothetical protein